MSGMLPTKWPVPGTREAFQPARVADILIRNEICDWGDDEKADKEASWMFRELLRQKRYDGGDHLDVLLALLSLLKRTELKVNRTSEQRDNDSL